MSEAIKKNSANEPEQHYSLNDDRRVKVLSPGAMVAKRFFRNRLAVVGLTMLVIMFLFSFVGGLVSPYGQDQQFYTTTTLKLDYAGVTENSSYRYTVADGQEFGALLQAQLIGAINDDATEFTYKDVTYTVVEEAPEVYTVYQGNTLLVLAAKDIFTVADGSEDPGFQLRLDAIRANANGETEFTSDGTDYTIDADGNVMQGGTEIGYIGRYVVSASSGNNTAITKDFREQLVEAIEADQEEFTYTDATGTEAEYFITYDPSIDSWKITQMTETQIYDRYSSPSAEHWLGTDTNGMDMLTRLMYGGRVSLVIGFIVVIIAGVLGVLLGGVAGYFGHWVDNLIMRIVDVFYCIPSMPIIIILGSTMDALNVDPQLRMLYLMLILGFLSWPSIARLVRGQILSLREQEFMTAAEACGISAWHRIIRHLIPNVIPQLIVTCTMSLGSTIITEATLSFLGLGVKFPFASWGNIINDVNDAFVMTNYLFIWIPAGICLLVTVLGFNFVGDGLRDAFDPKMKR